MNRYVFAALAVALGVAVQSLPQHRFQTYQVSYTAGKPADGGSLGVGDAAPADPIIPDSESAPTEPVSISKVSQVNEFQKLWKQAAQNLVTIPHLLQWVSSLNADSLMGSIIPQKATVEEAVDVPVETEANVIVQEPETITDIYETEVTTEPAIIEQIAAEPTQIMTEPDIPASQPEEIKEVISVEPEVIVEEEPIVIVQEEIIEEPIPTKPQEEIIVVEEQPIDPEIIEEVVAVQPEQVPEVIQSEPIEEVTMSEPEPVLSSIQHEPIEEIPAAQPEPTEVLAANPEPIEVLIAEPEPEIIVHQEIMKETQPEPIQKKDIWENQFVQKTIPQFEKPVVERKKAISKFKYNRFSARKQSAKKGKTLFSFAPEPQASPFALDAFAFPAYSYSISHQPSATYYRRL